MVRIARVAQIVKAVTAWMVYREMEAAFAIKVGLLEPQIPVQFVPQDSVDPFAEVKKTIFLS